MITLQFNHQGARLRAEHVEPVDKAHRLATIWSTDLRRELAGEHVALDTNPEGFLLTVETSKGDAAVLRIFAMLSALPQQMAGAGVKWSGPG